jgi:hypothetical protein
MEWILRALPSRPQPIWIRYGVTTLLVGLCFLLMKGVQEFSPIQAYFLLFPAIFLASIAFDRGSGFLATGLSALLLARWGGDLGHAQYSTEHWLSLGLFVGIGFALAAVSEGLRLGWERGAGELVFRQLTTVVLAPASVAMRMASSGFEAMAL